MSERHTSLSDGIRRASWRPVSDDSRAAHLATIDDALAAQAGRARSVFRARRRMSVAVVAAAFVVLPTGIAFAAESSLPGDVLYPIKKVTETVRSWVDDDVVAEHRIEELEELVASDAAREVIADQVDRATTEVDRLGPGHQLGPRLDAALAGGGVVADDATPTRGGDEGPSGRVDERPVGEPTTTTAATDAITTATTATIIDVPTTSVLPPERTTTTTTIVNSSTTTTVPPEVETYRVVGYVHAGPTCPVVRFPPDPDCADRPVSGAVLVIADEAGKELKRVESTTEGRFEFRLPNGSYVLVPQRHEGLLGTAPPQEFVVNRAPFLLDVAYDTGIR